MPTSSEAPYQLTPTETAAVDTSQTHHQAIKQHNIAQKVVLGDTQDRISDIHRRQEEAEQRLVDRHYPREVPTEAWQRFNQRRAADRAVTTAIMAEQSTKVAPIREAISQEHQKATTHSEDNLDVLRGAAVKLANQEIAQRIAESGGEPVWIPTRRTDNSTTGRKELALVHDPAIRNDEAHNFETELVRVPTGKDGHGFSIQEQYGNYSPAKPKSDLAS